MLEEISFTRDARPGYRVAVHAQLAEADSHRPEAAWLGQPIEFSSRASREHVSTRCD
jgi:hypothetical protein